MFSGSCQVPRPIRRPARPGASSGKAWPGALLSFAILAVLFWYLGGWMASGLAHWVDWVAHAGTILLTLVLVWFLFPVAVTAVASLLPG